MQKKSRTELKKLMKKDEIETKEALDYLKNISEQYIEDRGKLLADLKLVEAKAIHDELGNIYLMVANKIKNDEIKKSLIYFANLWLRSGETEIFIEPSLPKQVHETTKKHPEAVFSIEELKIGLGAPIEMPQIEINENLKGTADRSIISMSEREDEW